MKFSCDGAVIGGGAIGLACAWRLAQRGARVEIFERNQIAREASYAAAGMLAAQCEAAVHPPSSQREYSGREAFFELCLQSRALYANFAAELLEFTGCDVELSLQNAPTTDWRTPGILYVSNGNDDETLRCFEAQKQNGLHAEYSRHGDARAVWLEDEGQIDNRKLVHALKIACEKSGVVLHENSPLNLEEARQIGEKILVCGGAWSDQIAPEFSLKVRPVAGEVLSARPMEKLNRVLYSRDVYLVPRRDGRVLIGATMEERGFDKSISNSARETLLEAANALAAGAKSWTIEEHWAGLRPASEDGLPILGHTDLENVFVATGHFRNGILLTPITAQLAADCILENRETPDAFSIERFTAGAL
jgi:glycine oxidase ThiO